jgi:hypothetical protein
VPVPATAYLVVAGFLVLAAFQAAIALGAPVGRAAWGGRHAGQLPANLRVASAVAVGIYLAAALVVLDRAGIPLIDIPDAVSFWATWALVVLLGLGAVMNFASSSPYERFGWAPFALAMCLLTLVIALS